MKFTPPGVVIANDADPAWTAALALAAGRGQPILWITPPLLGPNRPARDPDDRYSLEQTDSFASLIEAACTTTGYSWNALGDDLDAVTLCLATPVATNTPTGDNRAMLATTDLVGRSRPPSPTTTTTTPTPPADTRARWAWCGQIFGCESRAAYMAMCSLFLQPRSAWLFDGYEHTPPFSDFDATPAADFLRQAGFDCTLDDAPSQSDDTWRRRIAGAPELLRDSPANTPGGIDAGLIAVNTSGYADFFDLKPGQCKATDVPLLRIPAIVHFVHSWSAHQIASRTKIAGRFLSNGAYLYVGSVHEPYLSAFVPTPLLMQRLLATAPVGVAARLDDAPPWKVAIIGDPLFTLGPPPPLLSSPSPVPPPALAGAIDLSTLLTKAIETNDPDTAILLLSLLGRDADATSLVTARLAESPITLSPAAARAGALSLFRAPPISPPPTPSSFPAHLLIARLIAHAPGAAAESPDLLDALWHSVYPHLGSLPHEVIDILKVHLRPEQLPRDAIDLAGAIRRTSGHDAAKAYLRSVRQGVTYDPWKKELDRAIGR